MLENNQPLKHASEMSDDEYRAARAAIVVRHPASPVITSADTKQAAEMSDAEYATAMASFGYWRRLG